MSERKNQALAVHGGEVFRQARKYGIRIDEIIDFSANINPLGLPPGVDSALQEALSNLANYPEIDGESLRFSVAERHNLAAENVIVGNGSSALIYLLTRALQPKKSIIWSPTFTEYERALKQAHSEVVNFDCLNPGKKITLEKIIASTVKARPDLVFICNPNNPTGHLWSIMDLEKIISDFKKAGIILVLDEAFIDFVGFAASCGSRVEEFDNLIVLRSLTKIYALAGIRCGYLLSGRSLNWRLLSCLEPWSVNTLALNAAVTALANDNEFIEKTRAFIAEERAYLGNGLNKLEFLKSYPAAANYILTRMDSKINGKKLRDYLFSRDNILIRLCGDYAGLSDNFVRFAVKNRAENQRLLKGLSAFQEEKITGSRSYI